MAVKYEAVGEVEGAEFFPIVIRDQLSDLDEGAMGRRVDRLIESTCVKNIC